jgi:hypothetical protein
MRSQLAHQLRPNTSRASFRQKNGSVKTKTVGNTRVRIVADRTLKCQWVSPYLRPGLPGARQHRPLSLDDMSREADHHGSAKWTVICANLLTKL